MVQRDNSLAVDMLPLQSVPHQAWVHMRRSSTDRRHCNRRQGTDRGIDSQEDRPQGTARAVGALLVDASVLRAWAAHWAGTCLVWEQRWVDRTDVQSCAS